MEEMSVFNIILKYNIINDKCATPIQARSSC